MFLHGQSVNARHISAVVRHYLPKFAQYRVMYGLNAQEMDCFERLSTAYERFEDDYRAKVGDLDLEWCVGVAHYTMQLPGPVPSVYYSEGMRRWPTSETNPASQRGIRPADHRIAVHAW